MADIIVNLKTPSEEPENSHRLLPRTQAEAVIETDNQQFISKKLKDSIYNKQDKLNYVPVNKAGDVLTGHLILPNSNFTQDNQVISKKYVDDKIKELVNGSPEALDTIYELAAAINNNPNFAVTVMEKLGEKLSKTEATVVKAPNKLLYTNDDGNLVTDLIGNADTASSLKDGFTLSLSGDIPIVSDRVYGNEDIDLNITLPIVSLSNNGIITKEFYNQLLEGLGVIDNPNFYPIKVNIISDDFIHDEITDYYINTITINDLNDISTLKIFKQIDVNTFIIPVADVEIEKLVDTQNIKIKSLEPFNGYIYYNLSTNK